MTKQARELFKNITISNLFSPLFWGKYLTGGCKKTRDNISLRDIKAHTNIPFHERRLTHKDLEFNARIKANRFMNKENISVKNYGDSRTYKMRNSR
jgi:hypothetical protein